MKKSKYTRLLAIDGGGIKGIIPGKILISLEKKIKTRKGEESSLADCFDMIAGTSTGGILAAGILCPDSSGSHAAYSVSDLVDIYLKRGKDIFKADIKHKIESMGGLREEKYPAEGLEKALNDYFGETELKELLRPCLMASYNIEKRYAHFFKSHKADNPAYNFKLKEAARGTSAAPTYFEPALVSSFSGTKYPLIDGAVFANNPALCLYAEARNYFPLTQGANDMVILSLGTGEIRKPYDYEQVKKWGIAEWALPALDILMSAGGETADFQLKEIFRSVDGESRYLRVQPEVPSWISPDLDNVSDTNLKNLAIFGEELANQFDNELERIADLLCE